RQRHAAVRAAGSRDPLRRGGARRRDGRAGIGSFGPACGGRARARSCTGSAFPASRAVSISVAAQGGPLGQGADRAAGLVILGAADEGCAPPDRCGSLQLFVSAGVTAGSSREEYRRMPLNRITAALCGAAVLALPAFSAMADDREPTAEE